MTTGAALHGITDAVRNIVLKWALQLEADGILGEKLAFSKEEKAAAENASYHIQNFYAGDIHGSQFQQQSPNAIQIGEFANLDHAKIGNFLRSLESSLDDLKLPKRDEEQVSVDIKTVDTQLGAPEPKKAIIKESLLSLRRVLEGAGGTIAAGLLKFLTKTLGGE